MPQLRFVIPEEDAALQRIRDQYGCSRDRAVELLNREPKRLKREPQRPHWADEKE